MRCLACNNLLLPHEDARKFKESGERVQLCDNDFSHVEGVETTTELWEDDDSVDSGDDAFVSFDDFMDNLEGEVDE